MLDVKVFSDFACPFCYLGLYLLEKLEDDNIRYIVDWIPFELDPNAPIKGMDLFEIYPKDYILKSLDMLSQLGKEYGIDFNNKNNKYNTRRAHLGGYYAKEQNKYSEYSKAMFKAYFGDCINIGDKLEVDKIAQKIGLDVEAMNKAIDAGKYNNLLNQAQSAAEAYKIQSIPSFVINEKSKLTGIRDYERFKQEFLDMI